MRYLKVTFYSTLLVFVILVSVCAFFLMTTPGFYTAVKIANWTLPGTIKLKKPSGALFDAIGFSELFYEDNTLKLHLKGAALQVKLSSLLRKKLVINNFHANQLTIEIKDTPNAIKKTTKIEPYLPELPLTIELHQITLNELRLKQAGSEQTARNLTLNATFNNSWWTIQQFAINLQGTQLQLQAKGMPHAPYALTATLTLSQAASNDHAIVGKIQLQGAWDLYRVWGILQKPAQATLNGTLRHGKQIELKAQWRDSRYALNKTQSIHSQNGHIIIQGTWTDLVIKANATFDEPMQATWFLNARVLNNQLTANSHFTTPAGTVKGTLSYNEQNNPKIQGTLKANQLTLIPWGVPITKFNLNTTVKGNTPELMNAHTHLSANYLGHPLNAEIFGTQTDIKARVNLGPNHVTLQGKPPYVWQASATIPKPNFLHETLSGLDSTLNVNLDIKGPQDGTLELTIKPGAYLTPEQPHLPPLEFQGGRLKFLLSDRGLAGDGHLTIDKSKRLNTEVFLPNMALNRPIKKSQPLTGQLSLNVDSLSFINHLSSAIEKLKGALRLDLTAKGTLQQPNLKGQLAVKDASLYLPKLNLLLNPVQLTLETVGAHWKGSGLIVSEGKRLTLSGEGQLSPQPIGKLTVDGQAFPILQTAEYKLQITPNLTLTAHPSHVDIQGSLLVPSATLKPISFSQSVDLTDDAVFVRDQKKPSSQNWTMNIQLKMGENVTLDVKGLHGYLNGAVDIKKTLESEPFAVGELTIRDGKYQAYGQNLIIEEGQLMFTGSKITNPGIRVRAVRYFKNSTSQFSGSNRWFDFSTANIQSVNLGNKTTVGIEVSGRVNNPDVKLFSIPSNLSQADILSMLLLGKPANQASQSGGQLLLTAISAMNLDSGTKGTQLLSQLKQTLGFDFNIENASQYNQESNQVSDTTSFVIGKAITNRLYLSYNVGLFQEDSNVLTLKYLLNKFFSIQVTASDSGSGIDLLYTHSKD